MIRRGLGGGPLLPISCRLREVGEFGIIPKPTEYGGKVFPHRRRRPPISHDDQAVAACVERPLPRFRSSLMPKREKLPDALFKTGTEGGVCGRLARESGLCLRKHDAVVGCYEEQVINELRGLAANRLEMDIPGKSPARLYRLLRQNADGAPSGDCIFEGYAAGVRCATLPAAHWLLPSQGALLTIDSPFAAHYAVMYTDNE